MALCGVKSSCRAEDQYGPHWGTLGFAGTQVLYGARPQVGTQPWVGGGGDPNLKGRGWVWEGSPEHCFTPNSQHGPDSGSPALLHLPSLA